MLTQEKLGRAFSTSPMKRAKRGLKCNAAVVLGNLGTADDGGLLERLRDEEPDEMIREHAAWARSRLERR